MKNGIHPDYKEITVVMSDGTEVKTRSTMDTKDGVYRSEVDSKNGRVDRFKRRYGNADD